MMGAWFAGIHHFRTGGRGDEIPLVLVRLSQSVAALRMANALRELAPLPSDTACPLAVREMRFLRRPILSFSKDSPTDVRQRNNVSIV